MKALNILTTQIYLTGLASVVEATGASARYLSLASTASIPQLLTVLNVNCPQGQLSLKIKKIIIIIAFCQKPSCQEMFEKLPITMAACSQQLTDIGAQSLEPVLPG